MPKGRATLTIDKNALLSAVVRTKGYGDALLKHAAQQQAELQQIGSAYYQATLDGANQLFQDGVPNAAQPRKTLLTQLPSGKQARVDVAWKALSKGWRTNKSRRSRRNYKGPNPSVGAGLFWLDTGKLRSEFGGWIPGRGQATAKKPHIRFHINGQHEITYVLGFKKLPVRFLDAALRRALIEGAVAGRRGSALEDLPRIANTPRRGVYRAFWPEAYRPTMRPLAMRLGRAMQEQILKSLRRR